MADAMASSSLEDLCLHINMKITNIKKFILWRDIGDDSSKALLRKICKEVILVHELMKMMEMQVKQQEELKTSLKEIQKTAERAQQEAWHLLEQMLCCMPKPSQVSNAVLTVKHNGQTRDVEPKFEKKPAKGRRAIKEIALITTEEFGDVPAYMKGRITHDQINAIIQEINKAVVGKYKILYQPLKSMSAPVRNLYHRFIEEEIKDTNGVFFIVDEDIKQFTNLKLDKRFYIILSILRHCQRVREIRGLGLVRYAIC